MEVIETGEIKELSGIMKDTLNKQQKANSFDFINLNRQLENSKMRNKLKKKNTNIKSKLIKNQWPIHKSNSLTLFCRKIFIQKLSE